MKLASILVTVAALSAVCPAVQASRFDGDWRVTLVCPPHSASGDDAKGYTHHFPGKVVDGELSATHGHEGQPGWHFLRGPIKPSGAAALRLDGIVNSSDHALNNAARGKPYTYRVKAQFSESSGTGQRLSGRVCEFSFSR